MLKFRRSNAATDVQPGDGDFSSLAASAGRSKGSINLDRKCSFVGSQLGHSQATVLLRNLSLPLAWPVEEYFGTKKDWREFTVHLTIRSNQGGPQQFSKPVERINRTYTDIDFPDEFLFPDQGPDFCIEEGEGTSSQLTVLCKRTDEGAVGPSLVQTISRSLGRSIGLSWRRFSILMEGEGVGGNFCRYLEDQKKAAADAISVKGEEGAPNRSFLEELRQAGIREERRLEAAGHKSGNNSPSRHPRPPLPYSPATIDEHFLRLPRQQMADLDAAAGMCPIGIARFRLRNATLSGRTHSYTLERLPLGGGEAKSNMLPIYGNICAQILVQPSSLVSPLAQGSLDIFLSDAAILHQHLFCTLQGGQLRCWETKQSAQSRESEQDSSALDTLPKLAAAKTPLLCLQINQDTRLERTAFPTAFRLILEDNGEKKGETKEEEAEEGGRAPRQLLCICPTQSALIGWRNAIQLQKIDTGLWAEFALTKRNPHAAALGILPGTGPRPFQHLVGEEMTRNEERKGKKNGKDGGRGGEGPPPSVGLVNKRTNTLPAGTLADWKMGQFCDGHDGQRGTSLKDVQNGKADGGWGGGKGAERLASGPSRTTLVDAHQTMGGSPAASPQIARKWPQPAPPLSSPGLIRRLTQQAAKEPERHISWSLGHGAAAARGKRPNDARQLFRQQAPPPLSTTINGTIVEEGQQQWMRKEKKKVEERVVEDDEEEEEAIAKSAIAPENGGGGLFVLSLHIDGGGGEGNGKRREGKDEEKRGEGNTTIVPLPPHVHPTKEAPSKSGTKLPLPNSNSLLRPPSIPRQQQTNARIISNNCKMPSPAHHHNIVRPPFNIHLLPPFSTPTAQEGRWARAQIGRSETWHFARTSQACTRL